MLLVSIARTPALCLISAPLIWVVLEYIRTFIFTGFPWALLGHSQFLRLNLIQIADLFGVYGVSFLIALINTSIFLVLAFLAKVPWRSRPVSKPMLAGSK